jgi:hypothetical protein
LNNKIKIKIQNVRKQLKSKETANKSTPADQDEVEDPWIFE